MRCCFLYRLFLPSQVVFSLQIRIIPSHQGAECKYPSPSRQRLHQTTAAGPALWHLRAQGAAVWWFLHFIYNQKWWLFHSCTLTCLQLSSLKYEKLQKRGTAAQLELNIHLWGDETTPASVQRSCKRWKQMSAWQHTSIPNNHNLNEALLTKLQLMMSSVFDELSFFTTVQLQMSLHFPPRSSALVSVPPFFLIIHLLKRFWLQTHKALQPLERSACTGASDARRRWELREAIFVPPAELWALLLWRPASN